MRITMKIKKKSMTDNIIKHNAYYIQLPDDDNRIMVDAITGWGPSLDSEKDYPVEDGWNAIETNDTRYFTQVSLGTIDAAILAVKAERYG